MMVPQIKLIQFPDMLMTRMSFKFTIPFQIPPFSNTMICHTMEHQTRLIPSADMLTMKMYEEKREVMIQNQVNEIIDAG